MAVLDILKFRLVIRGGEEDSPVLCTCDTTYDIREVVTSNVLLLLPELHFNDESEANRSNKTVQRVLSFKLYLRLLLFGLLTKYFKTSFIWFIYVCICEIIQSVMFEVKLRRLLRNVVDIVCLDLRYNSWYY